MELLDDLLLLHVSCHGIKDEGGGVPPPFLAAHFGDPEGHARRTLGDEAYERARADGYSMTPDQARAYALEAASSTA